MSVPAVALGAPVDPIQQEYQSSGGAGGPLGAATSGEDCTLPDAGCTESFENGAIYWSAATGAHYVLDRGDIAGFWHDHDDLTGSIGYPLSDTVCSSSGDVCGQDFVGADVSWSAADGAHAIPGLLRQRWEQSNGALGALGPATGDAACDASGCGQDFAGGSVSMYSDDSRAAYLVQSPMLSSWDARGRLASTLYPKGDQFCGLVNGGCGQHFELGSLYWSPSTGVKEVPNDIQLAWARAGWENGWLGYPVSEARCTVVGGRCAQNFAGGGVLSTPGNAYAVGGAIGAYWAATGYENGPLGYPASDIRCGAREGGCLQSFANDAVTWTPALGAHAVGGEIGWKWGVLGWEGGWVGYPTTDVRCGARNGGCLQGFEGGAIVQSTRGTHAVGGAIGAYWGATGWENGPLGYPAGDVRCGAAQGGCLQGFEGGAVTWTPSTGTHAVGGAIGSFWGSTGWENGSLGYPVADASCNSQGCTQRFQGGTVRSNNYGIAWKQ